MRQDRITREIQYHDRDLYCAKDYKGRMSIFRKSFVHEDCWLDDHTVIKSLVFRPQYIMSLTDNWAASGCPVEWGLDPILRRLREIDSHNRDLMIEIEANHDKAKASKQRALESETEAFVKDWRREFAKATNDINTSTMEKKDSRRLAERKVRYGYSK